VTGGRVCSSQMEAQEMLWRGTWVSVQWRADGSG